MGSETSSGLRLCRIHPLLDELTDSSASSSTTPSLSTPTPSKDSSTSPDMNSCTSSDGTTPTSTSGLPNVRRGTFVKVPSSVMAAVYRRQAMISRTRMLPKKSSPTLRAIPLQTPDSSKHSQAKAQRSSGNSSPSSSMPSRRFGKEEMDYLTRIEAAMQNPVRSSTVKMWLTEAAEKGLDPQRIYEMAVKARPSHWTPAPPYSEVSPSSEMLTPSELAQLRQASNDADAYLQKVYPNLNSQKA